MRARDFLIEADNTLTVGTLRKVRSGQPRYQIFLDKVKNQSPFTDKSGQAFVIDPNQYNELLYFFNNPENSGTLKVRGVDGTVISTSQLLKTGEFGGAAASFDNPNMVHKEKLPAKPSDVFQTKDVEGGKLNPAAALAVKQVLDAGAFPASQLYEKIAQSPVLLGAGDFGQIIINMAEQISNNTMPSAKGVDPTFYKAIRDYAGEYLGLMAVMQNLADFPEREEFFEFLDAPNLDDLIVYFPKNQANPLADSIGVRNSNTGHVISISSKGGKQGAPPSMSSLKVPDAFREIEEFKQVIEFFDLTSDENIPAKQQPFYIANYLFRQKIKFPWYYKNILPFSEDDILDLEFLMQRKFADEDFPKKFKVIANEFTGNGDGIPPGGIIHAVVNKDIIDLINGGAIPNFRKLVLEILGYNFVQLYSDFKGANKIFNVRVLWPAKLRGTVKVATKAYAAEPGKGKLSFSIT